MSCSKLQESEAVAIQPSETAAGQENVVEVGSPTFVRIKHR